MDYKNRQVSNHRIFLLIRFGGFGDVAPGGDILPIKNDVNNSTKIQRLTHSALAFAIFIRCCAVADISAKVIRMSKVILVGQG